MPKTRARWEVRPSRVGFGWDVVRNGKIVHWTLRKQGAIAIAVGWCHQRLDDERERSELVIKGRNGQIEDARTYGKDPRKSKG